jgi:hypothetical protein
MYIMSFLPSIQNLCGPLLPSMNQFRDCRVWFGEKLSVELLYRNPRYDQHRAEAQGVRCAHITPIINTNYQGVLKTYMFIANGIVLQIQWHPNSSVTNAQIAANVVLRKNYIGPDEILPEDAKILIDERGVIHAVTNLFIDGEEFVTGKGTEYHKMIGANKHVTTSWGAIGTATISKCTDNTRICKFMNDLQNPTTVQITYSQESSLLRKLSNRINSFVGDGACGANDRELQLHMMDCFTLDESAYTNCCNKFIDYIS